MIPAIFGLVGETLTDDERDFIRDAEPAGFLLFARNCRGRAPLRRLTDELRELAGRDHLPLLVDQEGGRVARLGPPEWPAFPSGAEFAALYRKAPISAIEAARANAEAIGIILAEVGINVDCAPLLDVRRPGSHDVIGDRALGDEPMQVAALGRATLDGLEAAGVCGLVKHMPGHGRAAEDSHVECPVVDAGEMALAEDLAPFRALCDAPMGMVAHILYPAWDAERAASVSPVVVADVIRGAIGFDGLLLSDDIGMAALRGPLDARARAVIAAGCDIVLHGSGRIEESAAIASALDPIGEAASGRLDRAMCRIAGRRSPNAFEALAAKRDSLLAYA